MERYINMSLKLEGKIYEHEPNILLHLISHELRIYRRI